MSVRRDRVRRTKPSAVSRLRPYRILIVLGIVALIVAIAFVVTWPGFAPKAVTVSGNRLVSRDEIVARAGVSSHINLWLQDPRAIALRVETIPYVDAANVRRVPPATIAIWVTERAPFAVVQADRQRVIVDRQLRVLGPAPAESDFPLFTLRGPVSLEPGTFLTGDAERTLRDAYDALTVAHVFARRLTFDRFGGLVATLGDGVTVLFGDDGDLARKDALVDPILAQAQRSGRRLATVDLRAPGTPVVTYK